MAEVHRHRGEWVQPGQTILRILRLDRLRAEGLVNAAAVPEGSMGRPVQLTVQIGDQPTKFTRQDRVRQPGDRSGQWPGAGVGGN